MHKKRQTEFKEIPQLFLNLLEGLSANTKINSSFYKSCPKCGTRWESLDAFLKDQDLRFNGYQEGLNRLYGGLFLFTHEACGCGSTIALPIGDFLPRIKSATAEKDQKPLLKQAAAPEEAGFSSQSSTGQEGKRTVPRRDIP